MQLRSTWPCQHAVAAFLHSQPLLQLLQAVLGSSSVLLYNGKQVGKLSRMEMVVCSCACVNV